MSAATKSLPKRRPYGVGNRWPPGAPVYIYAVSCDPYIKVGIASNLQRRLADIRALNPYKAEIVAAVAVQPRAAGLAEYKAHTALASRHHRGEWFKCWPHHAKDAISEAVPEAEDEVEQAETDRLQRWASRKSGHFQTQSLDEEDEISSKSVA